MFNLIFITLHEVFLKRNFVCCADIIKKALIISMLFGFPISLFAQKTTSIDTIIPGKGTPKQQIERSKEIKKQLLSDSGSQPKKNPLADTTIRNKYRDL